MMTEKCEGDQPSAPNMRSFSLNSDEAYEALCTPRERPWIPNGALPREPRVWGLPVIVEHSWRKPWPRQTPRTIPRAEVFGF